MSEKVYIDVDFTEGFKLISDANRELDELQNKTNEVVTEVNKTVAKSYSQILGMARSAYQVGLGMVKASGVSVSYFFRALVSAAFGAAAVIIPILKAEAATPGMQIQAAMGMAEMSVALMAVMAVQQQQMELARQLRGATMALSGIQIFISQIPSF